VALGQEADSALSELRFGDIVRSYGPEASLGLFMEEFSDAPVSLQQACRVLCAICLATVVRSWPNGLGSILLRCLMGVRIPPSVFSPDTRSVQYLHRSLRGTH
jgi:hypothetical protein